MGNFQKNKWTETMVGEKVKIRNYRIFFSFVFFVTLVLFFSPDISFAQSDQSNDTALTPTPSIDYAFPYPGILPDGPFYFLKVTRDRIAEFLISNPVKRANYDILQSDKRIEASYELVNERSGKTALAESTFSKGENYFEIAIGKTHEAKQQGMDIRDTVLKLRSSNAAHIEVLHNMEKIVGGEDKEKFERLESRLTGFEKKLKSLKL